MANKTERKKEYPAFYEKMVPIAVGIISLLTIILIAFTISLILN